jgi:DNA-binding winged helix-turn-helix (wHTH) protein
MVFFMMLPFTQGKCNGGGVERLSEVVTREELRQKLWPADTFVDFDTGLNSAIKKLRDALADSAEQPRYIETLGFGFCTL